MSHGQLFTSVAKRFTRQWIVSEMHDKELQVKPWGLSPHSHNTKYLYLVLWQHVCLPVKKIFLAVMLRPQTPHIDKREIRDAAIHGERRIHTSPSAPPPKKKKKKKKKKLGPLANKRAVSSDVTLWRCTLWSRKFASLSSYSIVKACSH